MPFDASGLGILLAVPAALFFFAMGFGCCALFYPIDVPSQLDNSERQSDAELFAIDRRREGEHV